MFGKRASGASAALAVIIVFMEAGTDGRAPEPGRAVDVAIAEFEALRAEIVAGRTIQSAFIGVGLTSMGVIFGFALQKHGRLNLLLVVPPLGLVLTLLFLAESFRVRRLGDYILSSLWPFLQGQTGYPHSWESQHFGHSRSLGDIISDSFFGAVVPLLFAAISSIAMIYAKVSSDLKVFGWCCTALTIAIPLAFGLKLLGRR